MTSDQNNEKIREVITTLMRATAEGDLETVLSLIAEGRGFPLAGSAAAARTRSFCSRPPFGASPSILAWVLRHRELETCTSNKDKFLNPSGAYVTLQYKQDVGKPEEDNYAPLFLTTFDKYPDLSGATISYWGPT
jgi:hypothetical protein